MKRKIRKNWILGLCAAACATLACAALPVGKMTAFAATHNSGWHKTGVTYNSEVKTNNTIDMRRRAYYEASAYEGSDLWAASGSNGQTTNRNGGGNVWYRRYADGTHYFGWAVIIPSDATSFYVDGAFSAMNGRMYIGCNLKDGGISEHGVENAFENVYAFDFETEKVIWRTFDVLQLLPKEEVKAQGNQYYIMITGKPGTLTYGGAVVERMRFAHNGTIYAVEDTVAPEIAKTERVGFTSDENSVNDGEYLIDGYNRDSDVETAYGRKFRKLDSFGSSAVTKYSINGKYAVYRFDFAGMDEQYYEFKKLLLSLDVLGEYRIGIATEESLGGEYTSAKLLNTEDNAYWSDIACGDPSFAEETRVLDVTDYYGKTVYLRISDATDNTSGGCMVGGIEFTSYYACTVPPMITVKEGIKGFVGYPVYLNGLFTVATGVEGYGTKLSYTVRNSENVRIKLETTGNAFIPTAAGDYSVSVKATDGNGNVTNQTFTLNVGAAGEVKGAEILSPTQTTVKSGQPLDCENGFLKLTAENGTVMIPLELCALDRNKFAALGEHTVTATYGEYSAKFTVNCIDCVSNIELVSAPTAVNYVGTFRLNWDGGAIKVSYASGASEILPLSADGIEVSGGFDYLREGGQTVTVSYKEGLCSFEIELKADEVASIEVTKFPTADIYDTNKIIDLSGGELTVRYVSGKTETVALDSKRISVGKADGKLKIRFCGAETTLALKQGKSSGCKSSAGIGCLVTLIGLASVVTFIRIKREKRENNKNSK